MVPMNEKSVTKSGSGPYAARVRGDNLPQYWFEGAFGHFARGNVPLDTNKAPVYAGMTCRKRERADRSVSKTE